MVTQRSEQRQTILELKKSIDPHIFVVPKGVYKKEIILFLSFLVLIAVVVSLWGLFPVEETTFLKFVMFVSITIPVVFFFDSFKALLGLKSKARENGLDKLEDYVWLNAYDDVIDYLESLPYELNDPEFKKNNWNNDFWHVRWELKRLYTEFVDTGKADVQGELSLPIFSGGQKTNQTLSVTLVIASPFRLEMKADVIMLSWWDHSWN